MFELIPRRTVVGLQKKRDGDGNEMLPMLNKTLYWRWIINFPNHKINIYTHQAFQLLGLDPSLWLCVSIGGGFRISTTGPIWIDRVMFKFGFDASLLRIWILLTRPRIRWLQHLLFIFFVIFFFLNLCYPVWCCGGYVSYNGDRRWLLSVDSIKRLGICASPARNQIAACPTTNHSVWKIRMFLRNFMAWNYNSTWQSVSGGRWFSEGAHQGWFDSHQSVLLAIDKIVWIS